MRCKDTDKMMKMMTATFAAEGRRMGQRVWREGDEQRHAAYEADLLTKAFVHGQVEVLLAASASAAPPPSPQHAAGAN